jgi:hypothetical protein
MYKKPSAPLTIGGVIDDAIQLYKAAFRACWLPSLAIALISAGVSLALQPKGGAAATPAEATAQMLALFTSPVVIGGYLLLIVVSTFFGLVITRIVYSVSQGAQSSLGSAMSFAIGKMPAALGAMILFLIAFLLGLILLIIPAIFVWNRLQLYLVALVAGDKSGVASLQESWRLVGGHWWRTFTIFSVLMIMVLVLIMVLGMVFGIVVAVARLDVATVLIATQLFTAIYTTFMLPAFYATLVAIHNDLKLRKDGGDLEARLNRVAAG